MSIISIIIGHVLCCVDCEFLLDVVASGSTWTANVWDNMGLETLFKERMIADRKKNTV